MRKELVAALLLAAFFAAVLLNIRAVNRLTADVITDVESATDRAMAGDTEAAARFAESAAEKWEDCGGYTHVVLRHAEIDAVADAIYELLLATRSGSPESVAAAAEKAAYHLRSIADIERIMPGSIF